MYRYYLTLTLILGIARLSSGQGQLDFKTVDGQTYKLYQEERWQELITFGEKAIEAGYDYYYLRMRTGIAAYMLKRYRQAISHFVRALDFNSNDPVARWYLYYCYLNANMFEYAKSVYYSFDENQRQEKELYPLRTIEAIDGEGGTKFSSATSIGNLKYFHFYLRHALLKKFSLMHAFTVTLQDNYWGGFLQNEYYLAGAFQLKKHWLIYPALKFTYLDISVSENRTYSAGGLTLSKQEGNIDFNFGVSVSNFYDSLQVQESVSLRWYPVGNEDYYLSAGLMTSKDGDKLGAAFKYDAFINLKKKLAFHLQFYHGNLMNVHEENLMIVNNSIDITRYRLNMTTSLKIWKYASVYLTYILEHKQEPLYREYLRGLEYDYNGVIFGIQIIP